MKTYFSLKSILNPSANTAADTPPLTPRDKLLADIHKTQCALEIAYSGFDNVTDPDLIDCYIYEVNSALKRYRFLLQQAESMQLYEKFQNSSEYDKYSGYVKFPEYIEDIEDDNTTSLNATALTIQQPLV